LFLEGNVFLLRQYGDMIFSKSEEIHLIYPTNILFSFTQRCKIFSLIYEKKALLKIPIFLLDSDDPGVILVM